MNSEKDIFIRLTDKAKTVALTEREKTALFSVVDSYVRKHPIQAQVKNPSKSSLAAPILSPFADTISTWTQSWHIHSFRAMAGALVLVIIIGLGGTSLAAQGSLPGDTLYPIMVNINEGLKSAFLSGTDQIEYEVARAKNRVQEAKQLVAENRLSPEIKEEITVHLSSHVSKVQKEVDVLAKSGDIKTAYVISAELESGLEENASTDTSVSTDTHSVTIAAVDTGIEDIVRAPLAAVSDSLEQTENQILAEGSNDDDARVVAEAKLDSTKKLVAMLDEMGVGGIGGSGAPAAMMVNLSAPVSEILTKTLAVSSTAATTASATTSAEIVGTSTPEMTIERAKELIARGEEKMAAQLYTEALALFKEANDLAQSLEKEMAPDVIIKDQTDAEIKIQTEIDTSSVDETNSNKINN